MKSIFLFIALITYQLSISQLGHKVPIYDAEDFLPKLHSLYTYTYSEQSDGCRTHINSFAAFKEPIVGHSGTESSFGYYRYDIKIELYGIDNIGNEVMLDSRMVYSPKYNGVHQVYFYKLYGDDPNNYLSIENLPYISYFCKLKITKLITNNDPGFLLFYPEAHWEQIENYPEPKCGNHGSITFFNGYTSPFNDTNPDDDEEKKPNLTISKVTIKVGDKTYDSTAMSDNVPIFKNGELHTFNVTIKNDDDGDASTSPYKLLVSEENKYPSIGSKPVYQYQSRNAGVINDNSVKTDSYSEYLYGKISSLNLESNKTYYMFIDIDPNDDVDESNENINDNVHVLQFKYSSTSSGKISLNINNSKTYVQYDHLNNATNTLRIVDLDNGLSCYQKDLIFSKNIVNLTMAIGFYGIYVNGYFAKKFAVTKGGYSAPLNPYYEQ